MEYNEFSFDNNFSMKKIELERADLYSSYSQ